MLWEALLTMTGIVDMVELIEETGILNGESK